MRGGELQWSPEEKVCSMERLTEFLSGEKIYMYMYMIALKLLKYNIEVHLNVHVHITGVITYVAMV